MTSFIKKILFLAISSVCLIHFHLAAFATGYTWVNGIGYDPDNPIPQRMEINQCANTPNCMNIYYLGLLGMQATPTGQTLSFYQICGIHGMARLWDGDNNGGSSIRYGYCQHSNTLFPMWHRPYMALYEQTLYNNAVKAVNGFPAGAVKNAHLAMLQTWRMPYWDWATNPIVPDIIGTNQYCIVTMMNKGKLQKMNVSNPLYSYRTNPQDPYTTVAGNSATGPVTTQTVRNPGITKNVYTSQPSVTNAKMSQAAASLKQGVYNCLTMTKDYNSFSNADASYNSVESVHNTVHGLIGGSNGHMAYPEYAGCDPIFFLHHANIDRIISMWQYLYPDSSLSDDSNVSPNVYTPLNPFRWDDDNFWIPYWLPDTSYFGYTYADVVDTTQANMRATINKMYGQSSSTKKGKRALPTNKGADKEQQLGYSAFAPGSLTGSATYTEYGVRIGISNICKHGTYTVNIFLGNPSSNQTECYTEPNYVGSHHVFTRKNLPGKNKKIIKGMVCLNRALEKRVSAGELKDMTPESVEPYLKTNLKWNMKGAEDEQYDYDGMHMIVVMSEVTPPKDEYHFPIWGDFKKLYKVV